MQNYTSRQDVEALVDEALGDLGSDYDQEALVDQLGRDFENDWASAAEYVSEPLNSFYALAARFDTTA